MPWTSKSETKLTANGASLIYYILYIFVYLASLENLSRRFENKTDVSDSFTNRQLSKLEPFCSVG